MYVYELTSVQNAVHIGTELSGVDVSILILIL